MEWVKAINDAIEFMEKNLTEKITLVDVANSVNISAFHFHHAFTIMAGITPAEYIRNRRLSLAGAEIVSSREGAGARPNDTNGTSDKIIDIAKQKKRHWMNRSQCCFFCVCLSCLHLARSSQKATADAAATLSESTL